jgi:hypothetical protein
MTRLRIADSGIRVRCKAPARYFADHLFLSHPARCEMRRERVSPGIKQPALQAEHWPQYSAQASNAWSRFPPHPAPPEYIIMACCLIEQGAVLPLPLVLFFFCGLFSVIVSSQTIWFRMLGWRMLNWRAFVRKQSLSNRTTVSEFPWRHWRKPRISSVLAEIRKKHLPNSILELWYMFTRTCSP